MNPDNIIVFLDSIQRTIIATLIDDTGDRVIVDKPVILNVTPTPDKKLQVQLYPLFFREFTADRDTFAKWSFSKSAIVTANVSLEPNLVAQYKQMFLTSIGDNKVVKLFDE